MDIVVAKYKENIDWVNKLSSHNVIVYNKGIKDNTWKFNLKNYGKDAETHLYHIINNYNNLADYTAFLQGNPFDHCNNVLELIENFNNRDSFLPLGPVYIRDNQDYIKQCKEYCEKMEMEYTQPFYFIGGMQLILHKNHIHTRSLDFYKKLKDDIPKIISYGSGVFFNSHEIWSLEYTWPTIFNINQNMSKFL